jgi:DNA transposition AAA+ family ATPase
VGVPAIKEFEYAGRGRPRKQPSAKESAEAERLLGYVWDWFETNQSDRDSKAKIIKISYYSLTQWRNGRKISLQGLEKLRYAREVIDESRKRRITYQSPLLEGKVIKNSTVKTVREILRTAFDNSEKRMFAVLGQSGLGKTTGLEAALRSKTYTQYKPNMKIEKGKRYYILILANQSHGPSFMTAKICTALGLSTQGCAGKLIDRAAEFLKKNPVGIIVDDADWYCSYKHLSYLRAIWQQAHCPMFLLGTDRYIEDLRSPEDRWAQLSARIDVTRLNRFDMDQVEEFYSAAGLSDWDKEVKKHIYNSQHANLHKILLFIGKLEHFSRINDIKSPSLEDAEMVESILMA